MMGAIYLAAEIPTQRAADDHVRGKMLLGGDAGDGHRGCQPIRRHLTEPPWIFVGPHTGNGPGNRRVLRGKRCSPLKKISMSVAVKGTLSLGNPLEQVCDCCAVDGSFATEQTGFLQVIVMGDMAKEK